MGTSDWCVAGLGFCGVRPQILQGGRTRILPYSGLIPLGKWTVFIRFRRRLRLLQCRRMSDNHRSRRTASRLARQRTFRKICPRGFSPCLDSADSFRRRGSHNRDRFGWPYCTSQHFRRFWSGFSSRSRQDPQFLINLIHIKFLGVKRVADPFRELLVFWMRRIGDSF